MAGMSTSQQFCLRWNNHQSNMMSVFEHLLQSELFTDVSVAVEGRTLKAHKMVLSACSPYFQAVLSTHPEKHPIVILKDIRYTDMRDLLDFMYRGEVSVDQENLSTFLRVAQSLRIKGLTEVGDKRGEPYLIQGPPPSSSPNSCISNLGSIAIAPPSTLLPGAPSTPLPGDPPPLKRPPLSPTATGAKRRRGRPPKISGEEESETEVGVSHDEESRSCSGGAGSVMGIAVETEIKMETEETSDHQKDGELSRPPSQQTDDVRAGPSGELIPRDLTNKNSEENNRQSPGSDVCCVPDIWVSEGKLMRLTPLTSPPPLTPLIPSNNTPLPSPPNGRHTPNLSNGTTLINHRFHGNSPNTTPNSNTTNSATTTPTLKVERPTPTVTPTSGLPPLTPSGLPLLPHPNFTAIMEPVQNMPLDLHIGDHDTSDSCSSDNISLDYVLNSNGSATCRLCGELLPSRNHWYRHKYKTHSSAHYRCDDCGVVYKSKRGYDTHMEVKHAKVKTAQPERPRRRDWEGVNRAMEEAKRKEEEAMVKAIIARVKIECAMEGEDCSRRGYQKH